MTVTRKTRYRTAVLRPYVLLGLALGMGFNSNANAR